MAATLDLSKVVIVEHHGDLSLFARLEREVPQDLKHEHLGLDLGDLHPDALSGTHSERQVGSGDNLALVLKKTVNIKPQISEAKAQSHTSGLKRSGLKGSPTPRPVI